MLGAEGKAARGTKPCVNPFSRFLKVVLPLTMLESLTSDSFMELKMLWERKAK